MGMNDSPNSKCKPGTTPRMGVMKITETGRNIRSHFGMIVLAHEPVDKRHDDMSPKAQFSLVLGRQVHGTGIKVLNLQTLRINMRNKFEEVPISPEAIAVVNAIADKESIISFEDMIEFDKKKLSLAPYINSEEMKDKLDKRIENENDKMENIDLSNLLSKESLKKHENVNNNDDKNDEDWNQVTNDVRINNEANDVESEYDNNEEIIIDKVNDDILTEPIWSEEPRRSKRMKPIVDYELLSGKKRKNYYNFETSYMVISNDVVSSDDHQKAMLNEVQQMLNMNVWHGIRYENLNEEQRNKCILSKGFSINKRDIEGKLIKVKGRLVALGNMQSDIVDEVSSPTSRFESILLFINIATYNGWDLEIIDIAGAYLHAKLNSDIYMWLDESTSKALLNLSPSYQDFVHNNKKILVKLDKAIYGLHESSLVWYKSLIETLNEIGYQTSKYDAAVTIIKENGVLVGFATLHVDDILSGGVKRVMEKLKDGLKKKYNNISVQDGDELQYNGIKLVRNRNDKSIFISQRGYAEEIIKNIKDIEIFDTPYHGNLFDVSIGSELLDDERKRWFRSTLMQFMFLTRTRPDIKLVVVVLSTRMENPTDFDEQSIYKLAGYIKGTLNLGLTLRPDEMQICCESDGSFGVHPDGKGHSGGICFIGNSIFKVESTKQPTVGISSTEVELISANKILQEVVWAKGILEECGYYQKEIIFGQDNKSSITIAKQGSGRMGRTKHMNVKYYFLSQFVQDGTIKLVHIPSTEILSDGLTKPLPKPKFLVWRNKILNLER